MIVIVILGVLAAAIIPNLSKFVGSGQLGAANAEVASVRTAIAAYQSEHNGSSPFGTAPAIDNALIQPYITGSAIKGDYSYDAATGLLTGTTAPFVTSPAMTWDATNQKWTK